MINLESFETVGHGGCGGCGSGKGGTSGVRCGNGLEKIYPTTAVRFGYMRYIGEFSHAPELKFSCGAKVVVQTQRGIEIGEQVSLTCNGCDKSVTREQMKEWVQRSGEDTYMFSAGRILREATAADLAEYSRIQNSSRQKRDLARQFTRRHNLPIKMVECECLFGGERIIFHFTADQRVDFRAMVKDLAQEYRTRIEMRQIGARDEARLLADYETCGREVCCKVFLKTLKPISMRMAKLQKATLDPAQVSGRCGRLKCCLRYEHIGYEELDKKLPRKGVRIRTNHGEGVVMNRQILTQLVQIRLDDGTLATVVVEDITDVNVKPQPAEAEAVRSAARPRSGRPGTPGRRSPQGDRGLTRQGAKREQVNEGESKEAVSGSAGIRDNEKKTDDQPSRRRRRRRRRRKSGPADASGGSPPANHG